MKLRTKFQDEDFELGEVVEANVYYGGNDRIKVITEATEGGMITFYFETLKGLNEMFEDAPEESKEYWYYDTTKNGVEKITHLEDKEKDQAIGNYFETREEAEKAVEKLKAWKLLKDECNIKFAGLIRDDSAMLKGVNLSYDRRTVTFDRMRECIDALYLLFGGEE